ncbi:MAG: hypothetical protein GWN74_15980, partial [Thermoplasmata archaeon]|nr:hypothetical protein [Thermoplasmata archaeon]
MGSDEELPLLFGQRDVGEGVLVVVVDDGIGNDTAHWDVNVTVPNEPPSVQIVRVPNGSPPTVGMPYTMYADVHDDDLGSLTVRWTVDGSPVGSGLDLTYTPTRAGPIVVEV